MDEEDEENEEKGKRNGRDKGKAKNRKRRGGGATFEVMLGSINTLALLFDEDYWLEAKEEIKGFYEKKQIVSVGYAFRAEYANYAENAHYATEDEMIECLNKVKLFFLTTLILYPSEIFFSRESIITD